MCVYLYHNLKLKQMKTLTAATNEQPNTPASLTEQFAHLTPVIGIKDYKQEAKILKGNLVAELKRNFPGVKFSVVKRHYSTYDITWTDGPTSDAVDKVVNLFVSYESSYCGDFRDFNPTLFNRTFGGYKYIFTNREQSEKVKALQERANEIAVSFGMDVRYGEGAQLLRSIFCKTTFPLKYESCSLERTEVTCGLREEFYKIVIK